MTHASRLSSALAKIKEDETSEESIETQDRKSQPSKCKICKEVFMSRNALFKHLDEKNQFCREWQQQPEVVEKTFPRACNGSHINPCPAVSSWQIQRKGRGSSVDKNIKCASLKDYSPTTCQQFCSSLRARSGRTQSSHRRQPDQHLRSFTRARQGCYHSAFSTLHPP